MRQVSIPALVLLVGLLGCGAGGDDVDRPATHPVTGVVTYQGNPVDGAQVTFISTAGGGGQGAFGRTDAEGRYALTTFEPDDGAIAGEYIVTITKYDAPPVPTAAEEEGSEEEYVPPEAGGVEEAPPKNELPNSYSTQQTSDLKAEVKEGENEISFTLTD